MRAALIRAGRGAFASSRFLGALGAATGGITSMIQSMASALGVPPSLALSVAQTESSLNPNAVSSKGAQGLFQLMPQTAASLGVANPLDPAQNTQGGLTYLSQLFRQFGNWADALAAYNWGPTNVAKYGAAAAPASTQAYVSRILGSSGPAAAASPSAPVFSSAASPAASSPYDNGNVIDVTPVVVSDATQPAAAAPNIFLLAMLGVGVYLAADVLRD